MHTMTLYALADRHWTFKAFVWDLIGGYRENFEIAVHRLEDQGMSRAAGHGSRVSTRDC